MKFEECLINSEKHSIEEIIEIYNTNKEEFNEKCYDKMFCPECNEAKLAFRPNAVTAYLSKKPTSQHRQEIEGELGCSYIYDEAKKNELDEYYKSKESLKGINRKLKSCIDLLTKPKKKGSEKGGGGKNGPSINKGTFTFVTKGRRVLIRRKKINIKLDNNDYNIPMLFYGRVRIKAKFYESNGNKVWCLYLTDIQNKKLLCSISAYPNIYDKLDESVRNIKDEEYNIAFMSEMKLNSNEKGNFNNCILKNESHIVIEKID